ncbi:hypothetical protein NYO12_10080 [Klebsiella variicola]|uniref:hypothetical protein n=1 Tax=Klebsiella variicola TaxID=244366 RepID=UPI00216785B4|nr:hypothetical protein [Klebsiella variicola]UVW54667.1 hypothetical protein NYO12_10080 [Klebsiella variicola]
MASIPHDYFIGADDKLVDFLEKQGEECIREIEKSNSVNKENGYKLLSILIVGIGSAFLLLTQNNQPYFITLGIGMFILYWAACAIYLVTGVLRVQVYALISSPPADLYPQHYKAFGPENYDELAERGFHSERTPISVIRRIRLANLHETAEELIEINGRVRKQLSRARIAVIIAPVFTLAIATVGCLLF